MWADLGECCIGASGEGCTIGAYLRDRERCKRVVGSRHAWWAVRELASRCWGCGNRGSGEFASIRCRRQVNVAVSIDLEHDAIPRSGYRGSDFVLWHTASISQSSNGSITSEADQQAAALLTPKPKFISLTWRLENGPTNRTKHSHTSRRETLV
jgi:hypothetical protein